MIILTCRLLDGVDVTPAETVRCRRWVVHWLDILATRRGYHFLLIGRRKWQKDHFVSRQRWGVLTLRYAGRPGGGRLLLLFVRRRGPQVALRQRQPTIWIVGPLTARHNSRRRYDWIICDACLCRELREKLRACFTSVTVCLPADRVRLGWLDQQYSSMLFNVCPSLCSLCLWSFTTRSSHFAVVQHAFSWRSISYI